MVYLEKYQHSPISQHIYKYQVVVDDFLPVDSKNQFLCSFSSNASEIWVSLLGKKKYCIFKKKKKKKKKFYLEKAYYKIRGGYQDGSIAANDLQILVKKKKFQIKKNI